MGDWMERGMSMLWHARIHALHRHDARSSAYCAHGREGENNQRLAGWLVQGWKAKMGNPGLRRWMLVCLLVG